MAPAARLGKEVGREAGLPYYADEVAQMTAWGSLLWLGQVSEPFLEEIFPRKEGGQSERPLPEPALY